MYGMALSNIVLAAWLILFFCILHHHTGQFGVLFLSRPPFLEADTTTAHVDRASSLFLQLMSLLLENLPELLIENFNSKETTWICLGFIKTYVGEWLLKFADFQDISPF